MNNLNLQEEIKVLLLRSGYTQCEIAQILKDKYGLKMSKGNFSLKLKNESIRFSELKILCDILGCEIKIVKKEKL